MSHDFRAVCDRARPEGSFQTSYPTRQRAWNDDAGVTWRRRGDNFLPLKQARRLFGQPDVLIMHVDASNVHEHTGADRDGLVEEVERAWADGADVMRDFEVAEFRDADQRTLVVIVEHC